MLRNVCICVGVGVLHGLIPGLIVGFLQQGAQSADYWYTKLNKPFCLLSSQQLSMGCSLSILVH